MIAIIYGNCINANSLTIVKYTYVNFRVLKISRREKMKKFK